VRAIGVLEWTAGARAAAPELAAGDVELAAGLLDAHGLGGRFLHRLATEGADVPPALVDAVAIDVAATHHMIARQIDAVRAFIVASGADPADVVILKGMSTYVVTGDESTARTGDVDIVVVDGIDLDATFCAMGFRRTRPPFMHELGEFTLDGVEIDVHHHFPIYSVPTDPDGAPRSTGSFAPLRVDADVDRFRRSARPGHDGVAADLRFAGAELSAIVLAGHAFMNFTNLWSISHREKPYVRLAELLDIERLLAVPDFDPALLVELEADLGAGQALDWVDTIARALLGRSVIPGRRRFEPPRCLWWHLWETVPLDTTDLLTPDWLDVAPLNERLGFSTVDPGEWFEVPTAPDPAVRTTGADPTGFAVKVDAERAITRVEVRRDDPRRAVRLRVDLGTPAIEIVVNEDGSIHTAGAPASVSVDGDGVISVDVADVRPGIDDLLVGVSVGADPTVSASVVPLRLRRSGGAPE
jgi:hypothetical protein